MSQIKIDILQRALIRERNARKQAEKILEAKAIELYNSNKVLKKINTDLESLLNRSDSQLQGVFENIIDAYVIMDLSGNILKMNRSALNLLGFENDKVQFNLMKMIRPNDYKKVATSFEELMEKGSLADFEISIKTNHNQHKIVHINASLIYDRDRPVAAQGIIRDITVFKEQELISHFINDIAQSILGTLDIYEIASKTANRIAEYLKVDICTIYTVNHAKNQVEKIIANGEKIDAVKDSIHRTNFDIGNGIVGNVAKTGVSKIIHDTTGDSSYVFDVNRNHSKLTVPIIIEDEVIGVIDSEHPNKNYFTEFQMSTIENITRFLGLKIRSVISLNEKEQAQRELLKSEKRLRTLISSLESGILLEDQNRRIVLTNSKFCEMFRIPVDPENMVGLDCTNAAEQSKNLFKDPDGFVARIDSILLNRETVIGDELVMVNEKILERDYIPLFTDNTYSGHLWNYKDVTIKKNYSQRLEAQKQKYSNILANMNLGLLEVDNNDKILMCNQSFSEISGYLEEELLGKSAGEVFLGQKDLKVLKKQNKKRLEGYSSSYEIEAKNKNGEKRSWLVSGAPVHDIRGVIVGSIGIHLDITDQQQLQLEKDNLVSILKTKNEELQEYAQIVSHDLKSPLRNISALTAWIKQDNFKSFNEASLKHFDHLEQTLERMEELISGILKYSSITSDSGQMNSQDLNTVVFEIINTLHVPDHITISINNKLPIIYGDKIKFQQLFQNLLNNAITHIDKKNGYIDIGFEARNNEYQFYVKDNGIGIDKKYHKQIFRIFYYITKNKNSTGIGLSIVKKIVEIHGGKIWVESEPGIGTTFYFTIKK